MENENITFCGCKPSQKTAEPHGNFTGSYEKNVDTVGKKTS